ncbi:hypothetical protein PIB30_029944 [Stylosanthes scabra]|uniref:Uncharacterized protein n=1 Tax=Stylosanthes scabra TaxID=79078 RepID=A0ABU6V9R9_9FABA|nr:hypothetical protein [Stylosanthes scabra]
MNQLLDEWNGLGEIECKDVGPYRCVVTFSTPEIRDGDVDNELLHSVFDEVRPHWNFVWSLSRRVWIEKFQHSGDLIGIVPKRDLSAGNFFSGDKNREQNGYKDLHP